MSVATVALRRLARVDHAEGRWVIAGHVARSAMKWAVVWGIVYGLVVISTIESVIKAYPTLSQRVQLAQSAQQFAFIAGQARHLETVAGYTVWKVLTTTAFIGAIWGLRTSIGLLRGEEEAGRWELLLTGQTTRRRATLQAMLGLGAALLAMFMGTLVLTVLAGQLPGARFSTEGSVLFAVAMVAGAAMFLALGALASQLAATSGQATMLTTAVLGISYVVRVVADSSTSLGWVRWLTPMGWIEELRPFESSPPVALVPIAGFVLACAALTVVLAGRRDLNASVLRESEGRLSDTRWLIGPISLAIRLSRTAALGWLVGVAGYAALLGSAARSYASVLNSSPTVVAALGRLGVHNAAEGYLGIAFFITSAILALIAASQIAAMRDEEASGRLDNLLVRPVPRLIWLGGRLGIALALVLLAGLTAGLFTWVGAASQHTGVALPTLLEAGLNASVPAIAVLGVGVLVLAVRPQLTAAAVYGIVAWSFVVDLLAALIKGGDWLRDSSLFTHIALAPAAKPDWGTDIVMVLLALGAAALGALFFQRRDVEYA